ncbi:mutator 2 isoform X2 [Ptiloglossa arizonensis]|uniref:mutator 2 isoform X2 n=1 Tax=Ptiloglossa arizonensis TaxID=3350558 RepID=UPI003FA08270
MSGCVAIKRTATVSKRHAEIEANGRETTTWICDLNSSNKTKLNNSILRPGRFYELTDGSILEFGVVRAVYKVQRSVNDSLIPETPAPIRKNNLIISGTPDSSWNNSSTLGQNDSIIPGTQTENGESMFRRPTVPQRNSTTNEKNSFVHDSFTSDSMDDSSGFTARRKENVSEQRISIHDMETQKSSESQNEMNSDIHDAETQKICLNDIKTVKTHFQKKPIDIHDMKTPRKIERQNVSARDADDSIQDVRKHKTKKTGLTENSISDTVDVPKIEVKEGKYYSNDDSNCNDIDEEDTLNAVLTVKEEFCPHDEQIEGVQKCSEEYLQLSPSSTNFEDDCSEFDKSRNLLSSQDLLEDFIGNDDTLNASNSKSLSSAPIKSSCSNNNETTEKSKDNENIFDANTQTKNEDENIFEATTQRINFPFKAPLMADDSDETDQECMFQRYSRVASQDSQPSKSQSVVSEDEDTDEEGRFMEISIKQRQSTSLSFEVRQNESKEIMSGDSDDLFDVPTQHVNPKNEDSTATADVDFDGPTQLIKTKTSEDNLITEELEIDDMAPTQILPMAKSSPQVNKPIIHSRKNRAEETEDITEADYNIPTQVINNSEKVSESDKNESPSPFDKLNPTSVEEFSVEDIDYEMAPTQLISEIKSKSVSTADNRKKTLKKSNKTNLNDTLERNLNNIFDDVNEDDIEEQPQIRTTQVLINMLQLSQYEDKSDTSHKSDADNESPTIGKAKISQKHKRNKTSVIDSTSHSTPNKQSAKSSLKNTIIDSDSQNEENYFTKLASTRKQNVLKESQDFASSVENRSVNRKDGENATEANVSTMNDKNNSVCGTSFERLPMQKSSPRNEKLKVSKTILGKTDLSTKNKNESEESFKTGNQVSTISTGIKQPQQTSILLEKDDDDDILAGLPEFKISGTLSNPGSPTSSISTETRLNTNRNRSKQDKKKTEPKKKSAPQISTRRSSARGNMEDVKPYHSTRKSNSSTILESFGNFKVDKVSTNEHESDDENVTKRFKQSVRKTPSKNLRKTKGSRSLLQRKSISPIDTREQAKHNSSIQNGRAYNSSKENVDRSSVFQVGTEALAEDVTARPARKTTLSSSRVGKRSLSTTDVIESSNTKKFKKDTNESTSRITRHRKSTEKNTTISKKNSANIVDYMTKRNSSVNVQDSCNTQLSFSQESLQSKQLVIRIMKMSPTSPTERISQSTPAQSMAKNIVNNETRQTRRTSVKNRVASSDSTTSESEKAVPNITAQRKRSQRLTNKRQLEEEVVSSQGGEESQEVEMIMNVSFKEQNTGFNTKRKKEKHERTRNVKTKNTRKRASTILPVDENFEESNVSSDITESDNTQFEMSTSKFKPMEEYSKTNSNQSFVNNTMNNTNNMNKRGKKAKVRKLQTDKRQSKHLTETSTSSATNSSVDNASILSTPTRASTSGAFKIKHKILFTGITNDYSKLLKKLGASQVEDPAKCSVLVTDKVRRTVKFLCALAQSVPIVSINWLVESEKVGHFVELKDYILKDPVAEAKFGFKLRGSLEKAKQQKLLEGYTIVLTPNVAPPPLPELKSIINSCGGKPLVRPPSSWPQKTVIISREEDLAKAKTFLAKAPKTVTIQSTEFILTGILRQELNFIKHKLT